LTERSILHNIQSFYISLFGSWNESLIVVRTGPVVCIHNCILFKPTKQQIIPLKCVSVFYVWEREKTLKTKFGVIPFEVDTFELVLCPHSNESHHHYLAKTYEMKVFFTRSQHKKIVAFDVLLIFFMFLAKYLSTLPLLKVCASVVIFSVILC